MLEYVPGGGFFDLIEQTGGLGEQGGRYFMDQLTDILAYLSSKKVAHRDLKLDNIMLDENLNLKVADFGFATYRKIGALNTYRGTKTYMAPEIKEFKVYDGRKADMFSAGVILFIIVQGIFPFNEAVKEDYYWKLMASG
jgi:serine/threonine protein kinase